VEQWSFTPDKKSVLFNSNCNDIDRRHLWRVNASGGQVGQLTSGEGSNGAPWRSVTDKDLFILAPMQGIRHGLF